MKHNQSGFALTELFGLLIMLALFGGYIVNIIKLISDFGDTPVTTMFIGRCIGIFLMPLGAVLGFF